MSFLNIYSPNVFSITYLLIVVFSLVLRKQHYSLPNRLFILFTASTAIVLLLEVLSWYFEGRPGDGARRLNNVFNFIFLSLNPLPAVAWLCYLDYKIHTSGEHLRKRLYYTPIFLVTTILMIISGGTGWIYSIGENNAYHRGPGNIVYTIIIFLIIYSSLPMVIRNRKFIDRNIFIAFYAFTILPLAGAVLQLLYPGTMLVWNSVSLAVLTTFIFLEIQNLSKDFLTGLYNRRQFDEWINHRIRMCRKGKPSFSLILIDLDKFKEINDSHGHSEGDQALIIFSNILNQSVKNHDMIGRYGGDEFVVAVEAPEQNIAETVVNRIRTKVKEFNAKDIKPYNITFSAGTALFEKNKHKSAAQLFKEVDGKMYINKESVHP